MTDNNVKRAARLDTATLSDALDKCGINGQCHRIKPRSTEFRMAGRAWTLLYGPAGKPSGTVGDYIDDVPEGAVIVLDNGGFFLLLQFAEFPHPRFMLSGRNCLSQHGQTFSAITLNGHIGLHIFIDFGRIQFQMDDFGLLGIALQITCHPIVKPHSYSDQDIALIGQEIGCIVAMHTQFSDKIWMIFRKCP